MADALVSIALEALEKLTGVLGQQLSLFAGATDELRRLQKAFEHIKAVLHEAESKQVTEKKVRLWLSELRQVAYDIDDLLDKSLISGLETDGSDGNDDGADGDGGNRALAAACLSSPYSCLDGTVSRYKIARKIKEIRERLDQIDKDKNQFITSQISSFGVDRLPVRRSRTLATSHKEEEMIGRDGDEAAVISRLVSGSSSDDGQVQVIAIVGIGGLGKTTLARKIYHDGKVRDHFEKFLWVCVSDDFNVERLTKAIIEQVKKASTSFSELDSLQNELLELLRGKHFLLVLDDMWNDDKDKWNRLRPCLATGAPGSRILVTTRIQKVAKNTMDAAYTHELKGLPPNHSWKLFSSIAFDGREEEYLQFESVGREIVSKCKGVPLSIKVMASAMNSKKTVADWKNISDSQMWSLPEEENEILPALWLSYYNLPSHLKQCFVYCSIYRKDAEMPKDELVKLWIVQGYIKLQGNREKEDIGAEYSDQLVAWSMLEEFKNYREETIYKMHDLLHDLAQFITEDETYVYTSGKSNGRCTSVRHASLFLSETNPSIPMISGGAKTLRTLFLNEVNNIDTSFVNLFGPARFLRALLFRNSKFKTLPKIICKLKHLRYLDLSGSWIVELPNAIGKMKQLRYMDLSRSSIVELPNAIGKMKQLRYMDLSHTKLVELPESVSRLPNLHTLNLENCWRLKKLPREMGGMVNLRHLQIGDTWNLKCLPKGLGRISSLQSLSKFIVGGEGGCRIDELQRLNSLQGDLLIKNLERVSSGEEAKKAELCNKPHLRRLVLWNLERVEDIATSGRDAKIESMNSVLQGLRPHANLEELELFCRSSSKLPSWMEDSSFSKLKKLTIKGSIQCQQNLPGLGKLPELKYLEIRGVGVKKMGPELYYGNTGNNVVAGSIGAAFPKLEQLVLANMAELEEWELTSTEADADIIIMPSLCNLTLRDCPKLEGLPHRLAVALKHLTIEDCPSIKGTGCSSFPLLEEFTLGDSSEFFSSGLPHLPNLKKFYISGIRNETLPDGGWEQLVALRELKIGLCNELKSLADGLRLLQSLEILAVQGCCKLEWLPQGLGQLKKLKSLEISGAEALACLPASLGELESLEDLDMDGLKKLQSLPEGLGQLKKLEYLKISDAEALTCLPASLGELESLEDLDMHGLKILQSLPEGLGQLKKLQSLKISGAEALTSLPASLGELESLEHLDMGGLKKLQSLPEGLGQLAKLKSLEISGAEALTSLPESVAQLESLEHLKIIGWEKLESLPHWLGQMKKLLSLKIKDMKALTCLPDSLGQLESLQRLNISRCKNLKSLPRRLGQLESLTIAHLEAMTRPPDTLRQLKSLKRLKIGGWNELESLPRWLGQLKALTYLEVLDCGALRSLPPWLRDLPLLGRLQIKNCPLLSERCQWEGGEDWSKISHIPDIVVNNIQIQFTY